MKEVAKDLKLKSLTQEACGQDNSTELDKTRKLGVWVFNLKRR